jgi:hypothetical protein
MRTLWLTPYAAYLARVSIKLQKSGVIEAIRRWHTPCQMKRRRPRGDEKGVSNYFLFVGINDNGDSGWSSDTVTLLR